MPQAWPLDFAIEGGHKGNKARRHEVKALIGGNGAVTLRFALPLAGMLDINGFTLRRIARHLLMCGSHSDVRRLKVMGRWQTPKSRATLSTSGGA